MRASNRKFFNDRIDEISAFNIPDKSKLDLFARFWISRLQYDWPTPSEISKSDEQGQREKAATTIEDLRNLEHRNSEGLVAPTLKTEELRDVFLDELERMVNENAGFGNSRRITFPEEVKSFLKMANGVRDMDVRDDGICEWDLARDNCSEGREVQHLRKDVNGSFEMVDTKMRQTQWFKIEHELLVKTGFQTGGPTIQAGGGDYWYSYYLFCRRYTEEEVQENVYREEKEESYEKTDGWAWRIVFDSTSDKMTSPDVALLAFDTIPEFLDWYSTWESRLDELDLERVQAVYDESDLLEDD